MRKWIKRIAAILGGLVLALFLAIYFGGRWAAQKYLARDIAVGDGRVRLVAPQFRWSLDLSADSALYHSPNLDAEAGRTVVSANLFKSLIRFSPAVTLDVDTLSLSLKPDPDKDTTAVKPKRDSALAFPDFKLPAAVVVRAGRIVVADTGGSLARGDGILLETQGPKAVKLFIRDLEARQAGSLRQSLFLSADWSDSLALAARLVWRRTGDGDSSSDRGGSGDSLSLAVRLRKIDLMRGEADLRVHAASSSPYIRALGLSPTLPRAEAVNAEFRASLDGAIRLAGGLSATVDGFSDSAAYKLGTQKAALRLDFQDSAGTWSLKSAGSRGEDILLQGRFFVEATDSLADPAYLARHAGVSAQGHVRGITITAGGKTVRADLAVNEIRASGTAIRADIVTGDGSSVRADLRRETGSPKRVTLKKSAASNAKAAGAPPVPDWSGTFSAEFGPGERWVAAFVDTNVVFRKVRLRGAMIGGVVTAVSEAYGLKAYGVLADSLRLRHRYSPAGYVLEPSHLYFRNIDWVLAGTVKLAQAGNPLEFRLSNPEFGWVTFAMPGPDLMEAHARDLVLEKLPYKGLETLKENRPRLTADFAWNKRARSGSADAKVAGQYKGESLRVAARAEWTRDLLDIKGIEVSMEGSEIAATAKLLLHGRQFYELGKLVPADCEMASLSSDRFDLAKAMGVAMPAPPIKSGVAAGRFSFSAGSGFDGTYRIRDLRLNGEEEKFSIKELDLFGKGDSLIVKLVTTSTKEQFFNDSAVLSVTGVLGQVQGISLRARVGPKVFLDFRGRISEFKDLQGRLMVRGDAVLPGSSGELRNVRISADLAFPFKEGIKGMRLEADTLRLDYAVAGLDTQSISAPVKMQGGKVTVPRLTMRTRKGAELTGDFEFDPATRKMSGGLAGSGLAAQFGKGDRVKLKDIKVEVRADSLTLNVRAHIGSGSAEHVKAPMRAAGDFSAVDVTYRAPMGKPAAGASGGGRIPYLRVDATLDSSELRYRLRSMETLQNLFKRSPQKRVAKRSNPMQIQINLETSGSGNSIETDILRMRYVGNFSMSGVLPYALVQGRLSSQSGELGAKKQAYAIRRMDVKWLNTPMEEGKVDLEARKRLARDCEQGTTDSCNITTRLTGELSDLQFTYDSDCQGASGAGVEVAALIYSVRRGCYSSAFSSGGPGLSVGEQALGLLEPVASQYLSDAAGKLSGHWISSATVTGLGALASEKRKSIAGEEAAAANAGAQEAISLEILSKEFWRTRLRIATAYAPENVENTSPWNYRLGLEWRPPLTRFIDDPVWRDRVRNNVNVEAALFTDPDRTQDDRTDEGLRRRLGLNYNYDFWGGIWGEQGRARPASPSDAATATLPDSAR